MVSDHVGNVLYAEGAWLTDSGASIDTEEASRQHLTARLEVLETQVAIAVQRRRVSRRRVPDSQFRGLFLSEDEIDVLLGDGATDAGPLDDGSLDDGLLDRVEKAVSEAEAAGEPTRLRRLQRSFGLTAFETTVLITALAPELDPRFERLFAYLQNDLSCRRPTTALAVELAGCAPGLAGDAMVALRSALRPTGRLAGSGLLAIDHPDRPFLSRALRVPDRVTAYLLGDDTPDPVIEPHITPTVAWPGGSHTHLVNALRDGTPFFYLQERPGGSGSSAFAAALAEVGLRAVEIDLAAAAADIAIAELIPAVLREAGLNGAGLILTRADELARRDRLAVRRFAEVPAVVCFVGRSSWEPDWARALPYTVEASPTLSGAQANLWRIVLAENNLDECSGQDTGISADTLATLRMNPLQMICVVDWARRRAASQQRQLLLDDITDGARHLNSAALEQLSTRVTPSATWDDLVLVPPIERIVRKVAARARHRELVQGVWGFGAMSRRRGTIALFSGPPGTGKTLAAEVIAEELGVELYIVNLATVVDKYIGETEKNLERVFHAAEEVRGLIFFDEADALFGKRSEVRDARDRYANVEVAYLLQRLERFDGVAVLATNLSANLDEAFARRIDIAIDFKLPDTAQRLAIWRLCLPRALPLSADVDLDFLAEAFALSGGSIRNICVEAAYLAADDGGLVRMEHLIRATALERRKLGHLLSNSEFGDHFAIAAQELT